MGTSHEVGTSSHLKCKLSDCVVLLLSLKYTSWLCTERVSVLCTEAEKHACCQQADLLATCSGHLNSFHSFFLLSTWLDFEM